MSEDLRWFIGIMGGFLVADVGIVRNIYVKISANSAELHKRIDDVKAGYVRQDHLDRQMADMKAGLIEIKDDNRRTHAELTVGHGKLAEKLDEILADRR